MLNTKKQELPNWIETQIVVKTPNIPTQQKNFKKYKNQEDKMKVEIKKRIMTEKNHAAIFQKPKLENWPIFLWFQVQMNSYSSN